MYWVATKGCVDPPACLHETPHQRHILFLHFPRFKLPGQLRM